MIGLNCQAALALAIGVWNFGQTQPNIKTPAASTGVQVAPTTLTQSGLPVPEITPAATVLAGGGYASACDSTSCCKECRKRLITLPKSACVADECCDFYSTLKRCKHCDYRDAAGGDCSPCDGAGRTWRFRKTGGVCRDECKTKECGGFSLSGTGFGCFVHEVGYGFARTFWKIGDCCTCCDGCGNGAKKTIVPIKPINASCCSSPKLEPCCCKPRCQKRCDAGCESGCSSCSTQSSVVQAQAIAVAKAQAEAKARAEALAKAAKAEAEAKARAEAKAKAEAEAQALAIARAQAEAKAQALARAKAAAAQRATQVANGSNKKPVKRSVFAPKINETEPKSINDTSSKVWTVSKPKDDTTSQNSPPTGETVVRTTVTMKVPAQPTATAIPTTVTADRAVAATTAVPTVELPSASVQNTSVAEAVSSNAATITTHAADYSWLYGRLEKLSGRGGAWVVRYGAPAEQDDHGGMVVLAFDRRLNSFRSGEIVRVQGEVVGKEMKAYLGGPLYRIRTIERAK